MRWSCTLYTNSWHACHRKHAACCFSYSFYMLPPSLQPTCVWAPCSHPQFHTLAYCAFIFPMDTNARSHAWRPHHTLTAGSIAYEHCVTPKGPPLLVTASVDEITLQHPVSVKEDIVLQVRAPLRCTINVSLLLVQTHFLWPSTQLITPGCTPRVCTSQSLIACMPFQTRVHSSSDCGGRKCYKAESHKLRKAAPRL